MAHFWSQEMSSDYNLDRSTWHLQLKVQLPFSFLKILVLPILFHINAAEGYSILYSQKKLVLSRAKPFDCGGM